MRSKLATFVAVLLLALPAAATPPKTLSYQGFLTSSANAPIDGPVQMTFSLYTAPTAGLALWSETQPSVAVAKGEFSTILGNVTPLTLPFDVPYYLGVAVGADPEMTPRQPLASSAYAFRALAIDSGATFPGSVLTGSIPTATLPGTQITGSITTATLPGAQLTGSIDTATLPGSQVTGSITTATIPGSQVTGDLSGVNNILLPDSTASTGNVIKNGTVFLHNFGTRNTFLGASSGNLTTTGNDNSALGAFSLASNTSGTQNAALGTFALFANTTASSNTAVGWFALGSSSTASDNTALGNQALGFNTTAGTNVAVGSHALGAQSFSNTNTAWSSSNTAVGAFALASNQPTAVINGVSNTAIGASALLNNTNGATNTAAGAQALLNNTQGNNNVAVGYQASLHGTVGTANVAVGEQALSTSVSGNGNTAIGSGALASATSSGNIALGASAGFNLTTGGNNIMIGSLGVAGEASVIRIGGLPMPQTKTFITGINGVTTGSPAVNVVIDGNGQLGTVISSRAMKQDIEDMGSASDLLMKLRPVTFRYKGRPGWPLQYGLIAEEVAEVAPDLAARGSDGKVQTVYYQDLPPMLLNEFQKQQRVIEAQCAQLAAEHARVDALERELAAMKARLGWD